MRIALGVLGLLALLAAALGIIGHYRHPGSTFTLGLAAVSPYLIVAAGVSGRCSGSP